jgi:hypothetical protein
MNILDITITETSKLPKYSDEGRILFEVLSIDPDSKYSKYSKYEIEVIDWDEDSSVFWIREGVGFDYFINERYNFTEPGFYLIENIYGEYYKGDWGYDEDTEEWYSDEPIKLNNRIEELWKE